MDTPRKTRLYNQIAKDYTPKRAEMQICKYIEDIEAGFRQRIEALEAKASELASAETTVKRAKRTAETGASTPEQSTTPEPTTMA